MDPVVTDLVNTRELWFVLVANPDGYQYTFDSERLWRKNLRDNNGDSQITIGDGVDLNRNFDEHWNYDEEGSSTPTSSDTYRGSGPASEPETKAMQGLLDRLHFKFMVNYHSYGQLLLYSFGWQVQTPSADAPSFLPCQGQRPTRPSLGSIRALARISTPQMARRQTMPTPKPARLPPRPSWERAYRAMALSSPTTRANPG